MVQSITKKTRKKASRRKVSSSVVRRKKAVNSSTIHNDTGKISSVVEVLKRSSNSSSQKMAIPKTQDGINQATSITLKPPKRDPNAIYITFGFSLFMIFSIATFYTLQFLFEVINMNNGDVMGGQAKNEKLVTPVNSPVKDKFLIPDYLIKKGFSKGEINESALDSFYLSWPVKSGMGIVTQCFSEEHPGIDIADYRSPKVLASAEGYVIFAGCFEDDCPTDPDIKISEGLAHAVMIKHPNGMISVYGHLKSISVIEGEAVSKGDVIGIMGNSGNIQSISESGSGIHLHYALISDSSWNYLDPSQYMINKICVGGAPDLEAFWGQDKVEGKLEESISEQEESADGKVGIEGKMDEEALEVNEESIPPEPLKEPTNPNLTN